MPIAKEGHTGVLLAVISLLALLLRLIRLEFQPLWFDEGYSFFFATRDLGSIASMTAQDIHPPAYYYLLGGWLAAFGRADLSGRAVSVLLGLAAVPLVYALGRRLFDRHTAVIAAFLLAISPMHVYYSQEVRMYAMVTTLGLASSLLFSIAFGIRAGADERSVVPPKVRRWVLAGYVVLTALAMYTQYYAAFLPLAHGLFLLIRHRRAKYLWRSWLLAMLVVGGLFLPWLLYAGMKLSSYVQAKVAFEGYAPLSPYAFLRDLFFSFTAGDSASKYAPLAALLYLLLGAIAIVGLSVRISPRNLIDDMAQALPRYPGSTETSAPTSLHAAEGEQSPALQAADARFGVTQEPVAAKQRSTTRRAWFSPLSFSLLLLLVPIGVGWLVNLRFPFHPPMWERLFLFCLPALLLIVARGLALLFISRRLVAVVLILLCVSIAAVSLWSFYSIPRYPNEDYRPVVDLASALGHPDDLVLAIYPWQIGYFEAYYKGSLPTMLLAPSGAWANDTQEMALGLKSIAPQYGRMWLLSYQVLGRRLETQLEAYMVDHFYPATSKWFGNSRLLLFSTIEPPPTPAQAFNFENKLLATRTAMSQGPLVAGKDTVNLQLDWQALARLDGQFTVNLRLVDEADRTWAQRDAEPDSGLQSLASLAPGERLADRHGLLVPSGTPPGCYLLKLGISKDGAGLSALDEFGAPKGPEVVLGQVEVVRPSAAPSVSSLFVQHPSSALVAQGLRLVGFSGPTEPLAPGQKVPVNLFWQADGQLTADYDIHLALVDTRKNVIARVSGPPVDGKYPTSRWAAHELVRDQREIRIPVETPTGELTVMVSAGDSHTMTATARVQVVGREHSFTRPPMTHTEDLVADGLAELAGFDLEVPSQIGSEAGNDAGAWAVVRPGDPITLTLFWHPLATTEQDFTVFTHLLDAGGHIWGQVDSRPGSGNLPTTGWVPGEYLVDRYVLSLKPDTPDGPLALEVGVYDQLTGQRLSLKDHAGHSLGDSAILGTINVRH